MAALQSVPVYQIGSTNKLISPLPTYLALPSAQMIAQTVSGAPNNINGALIYSVITMNSQNSQSSTPVSYYTSLTVAAIIAAS